MQEAANNKCLKTGRAGDSGHRVLVCLALAAVTAVVYWPASGFDFINFDDSTMVLANPYVLAGLTWNGVRWALTTSWFEYWHPLTWLSHMLDCELFGLNAAGHHLMSVALHIANTLLVYIVLERMTGAWRRSALVAALFALHPLHVESVAWVAERKDVLSAFFFLLTLWAYAEYVQSLSTLRSAATEDGKSKVQSPPHPSSVAVLRRVDASRFYLLSLLSFACGLMSKPMVVTLPFVLLLLDFWPLRRLDGGGSVAASPLSAVSEGAGLAGMRALPLLWKRLLLEKVPFFALTAVSCVITWLGVKAGGFMISAEKVPWDLRLANVPVSYVRYLGKVIWPVNLSVLYPMPKELPVWQVMGCLAILVLISLAVLKLLRRQPWLLVGWCWFLGILVPVIGLLQVGHQAIADRYTYLPAIGLFVGMVWAGSELLRRWRVPSKVVWILGGTLVLFCLGASTVQLRHWKNSLMLWEHALAVTARNGDAHHNYAFALEQSGDIAGAMREYRTAVEIEPELYLAHNNLGRLLCQTGDLAGATNHLFQAVRILPDKSMAHGNLARALAMLGEWTGAEQQYQRAMALAPTDPTIPIDWGKVLLANNRYQEAIDRFAKALQVKVDSSEARLGYAFALGQLGASLAAEGKSVEALHNYREALRLQPDLPEVLNNLAWLLATAKDGHVRNGSEAVQQAQRACELTQFQNPLMVGTLAAAYAEAGQFEQARTAAEKAIALAEGAGNPELAAKNRELLKLYEAGKGYREAGLATEGHR